MRIVRDTYTVEWTVGGHYGNVFDNHGNEFDCFSFAWEKDKATQQDFMDAFERWEL